MSARYTIEDILRAFEAGKLTLEEATHWIDLERQILIANAKMEAIDKPPEKEADE